MSATKKELTHEVPPQRPLDELYLAHCIAMHVKKPNHYILEVLKEATATGNDIVTELDFSPTFLGKRGVLPLLEVLCACPNLNTLILSNTGMRDEGCIGLCEALLHHTGIRSIDLSSNMITMESVSALKQLVSQQLVCHHVRLDIKLSKNMNIYDSTIHEINAASMRNIVSAAVVALDEAKGPKGEEEGGKKKKHSSVSFEVDYQLVKRRLDQTMAVGRKLLRRIPTTADGWLVLSVYISTPFTGFSDEIRVFKDIVFPRVNQRLQKYQVYLVPVDFHQSAVFESERKAAWEEQFLKDVASKRQQMHKKEKAFREAQAQWLVNESAAYTTKIRRFGVEHCCDVFLGLYDGRYCAAQQADWEARTNFAWTVLGANHQRGDVMIPVLSYHRTTNGVPVALKEHFFGTDDGGAEQCFYAGEVKQYVPAHELKRRQRIANAKADLLKKINAVPKSCQYDYQANFDVVDQGGICHFNFQDENHFIRTACQDLLTIGLMLRGKKTTIKYPTPISLPPHLLRLEQAAAPSSSGSGITSISHLRSSFLPTMNGPKNGSGYKVGGLAQQSSMAKAKSAFDEEPTPVFHDEDGEEEDDEEAAAQKRKEAQEPQKLSPEEVIIAKNDEVMKKMIQSTSVWNMICGLKGSGKSFCLQILANCLKRNGGRFAVDINPMEIKVPSKQLLIYHSMMDDKPQLIVVLRRILEQLGATDPMNKFYATSSTANGRNEMLEDFYITFGEKMKERKEAGYEEVVILVDDDDIVDWSTRFSSLSAENPEKLQAVIPEGMSLRIFFTTSDAENIKNTSKMLVEKIPVPKWDLEEGVAFFLALLDDLSEETRKQARQAANFIVLQRKHGLRPLYLMLAAQEARFFTEETTMPVICEALPETIEGLCEFLMTERVPLDLASPFTAIAATPFPVPGVILQHLLFPTSSKKYSWWKRDAIASMKNDTRSWGRYLSAAPGTMLQLMVFYVNYAHLLVFPTDAAVENNVMRGRWGFFSHCLHEAAKKVYCASSSSAPALFNSVTVTPSTKSITPRKAVQNTFVAFGDSSPPTDDPFASSTESGALTSSTPEIIHPVWNQVVKRLSLFRQTPYAMLLLGENSGRLVGSAHPAFSLLYTGNSNALRDMISKIKNGEISLFAEGIDPSIGQGYYNYLQQYWEILKRFPIFMFACRDVLVGAKTSRGDRIFSSKQELVKEHLDQAFAEMRCAHLEPVAPRITFEDLCQLGGLDIDLIQSTISAPQFSNSVNSAVGASFNSSTRSILSMPVDKSIVAMKTNTVNENFLVLYRSFETGRTKDASSLISTPPPLPHCSNAFNPYFGVLAILFPNLLHQTGGKFEGCVLAKQVHDTAICNVEIVETKYTQRIVTAAYHGTKIVVLGLYFEPSEDGKDDVLTPQLVTVAMLPIQNPTDVLNPKSPLSPGSLRKTICQVSLSPTVCYGLLKGEINQDDGQYCPSVAFGLDTQLIVYECQPHGRDDLLNCGFDLSQLKVGCHAMSGHSNNVVMHGFSPAGLKVFGIDTSGRMLVWGTVDSQCLGSCFGSTELGSMPLFARFIDADCIFLVTSRALKIWNSVTSQVTIIADCPSKSPMTRHFQVINAKPQSAASEEVSEVQKSIEALLPTPPSLSTVLEGFVCLDPEDECIKTYQAPPRPKPKDSELISQLQAAEEHVKKQKALQSKATKSAEGGGREAPTEDVPPTPLPLPFTEFKEVDRCSCVDLPRAKATKSITGTTKSTILQDAMHKWTWCFHDVLTAAINSESNTLHVFDIAGARRPVPLWFAIPELANEDGGSNVEQCDKLVPLQDVVVSVPLALRHCHPGGKKSQKEKRGIKDEVLIAVSDAGNGISVLKYVDGDLLYPTPFHVTNA